LVAAALLAAAEDAALAASPSAGTVTMVQGQATVDREAETLPLEFRDDIFLGDRIETAKRSRVRLLLGGRMLVTIRELSSVTITEEPGHSIVDVRAGTVGLEVASNLLGADESIEIRTPNATAALRGSVVIAEVTTPEDVPVSRITAREAALPVTVSWTGGAVPLESDHEIVVNGFGDEATVTPPHPLTAADQARADRIRSGREPKHALGLARGLNAALTDETKRAETELEKAVEETIAASADGSPSNPDLDLQDLTATHGESSDSASSQNASFSSTSSTGAASDTTTFSSTTTASRRSRGLSSSPPPRTTSPPPPPPRSSDGYGSGSDFSGGGRGHGAGGPPGRGPGGGGPAGRKK
jgi:hypothetical protein